MITATWEGKLAGSNQRIGKARDGHLFATKPYAAYRKALAWTLRVEYHTRPLSGPVSVVIEYKIDAARDLDSAIKPTLDALQDSGILKNDNQVARLLVVRSTHPRGQPDRVTLTVDWP